jgi:hypothetical protein
MSRKLVTCSAVTVPGIPLKTAARPAGEAEAASRRARAPPRDLWHFRYPIYPFYVYF